MADADVVQQTGREERADMSSHAANTDGSTRVRRRAVRLAFTVLAIVALIVGFAGYRSPVDADAGRGDPDAMTVVIGQQALGALEITPNGISQSFTVPTSPESPICDGIQEFQLHDVELLVSAPGEYECYTVSDQLVVAILDSNGLILTDTSVPFFVPLKDPHWVVAHFEDPPVLLAGETYSILAWRDNRRMAPYSLPPPGGNYAVQSGHIHMNNGYIDASLGSSPQVCPDHRTVIPHVPIYLSIDTNNGYPDGQLYGSPGSDAMEKVDLTQTTTVRVLAVYYDPLIGEVNYSDSLGAIPPHDYGGQRLHAIQGWHSPAAVAARLKNDIETGARGRVRIELTEVWRDRWPAHSPARTITWDHPVTGATLQTLTNWVGWGDSGNQLGHSDTYPGYKFIQEYDSDRWTTDPGIETLPSATFDYAGLFSTVLEGQSSTVADLVNAGTVDEIWVVADPTGRLHEAVMVKPGGDTSQLHNIGAPIAVAGLERRVAVMGLSYEASLPNAVHSFGHRVESMIARVYHGDPRGGIPRYCSEVNGTNGPFFRIFHCDENANPAQDYGAIGLIHRAYNSPDSPRYLTDLWSPDEVNFVGPKPTNEEEWYDYPDFSSSLPKPQQYCNEWGGCGTPGNRFGDKGRYYTWYLDHVPGNKGQSNGRWNNMWPYLFRMTCFPDL